MKRRFLIDANVSSRSRFWQSDNYETVPDPAWSDQQVWAYAAERGLTIITKDVDFEDRALTNAPPQVVRLCIGNMRRQVFRQFLSEAWPRVLAALAQPEVRLVRVYADRLEIS